MAINVAFFTVSGAEATVSPEGIRAEDVTVGNSTTITSVSGEYVRISTDEACRIGFGAAPAAGAILLQAGGLNDFGPFTSDGVTIHIGAA